MNKHQPFSLLFVIPFCLGLAGCATFGEKGKGTDSKSLVERIPFFGEKELEEPEPYPHPVKLAVTWTPDTLIQSGRTPTRGFGGRVFFYDEKSRPVPVDGSLVIHGFDDANNDPKRHLKRFEFTAEQFTNHFSQTDLGASYSVWIPWDAVGGEQSRISLVASFQPKEGNVIQGTPATILLPGKNSTSNQTSLSHLSTQYQRYKKATESAKPSSGLTTTTIARHSRGSIPEDQPAINLPGSSRASQPETERIAKQVDSSTRTPAMDLRIGKRSMNILPASATTPVQR